MNPLKHIDMLSVDIDIFDNRFNIHDVHTKCPLKYCNCIVYIYQHSVIERHCTCPRIKYCNSNLIVYNVNTSTE